MKKLRQVIKYFALFLLVGIVFINSTFATTIFDTLATINTDELETIGGSIVVGSCSTEKIKLHNDTKINITKYNSDVLTYEEYQEAKTLLRQAQMCTTSGVRNAVIEYYSVNEGSSISGNINCANHWPYIKMLLDWYSTRFYNGGKVYFNCTWMVALEIIQDKTESSYAGNSQLLNAEEYDYAMDLFYRANQCAETTTNNAVIDYYSANSGYSVGALFNCANHYQYTKQLLDWYSTKFYDGGRVDFNCTWREAKAIIYDKIENSQDKTSISTLLYMLNNTDGLEILKTNSSVFCLKHGQPLGTLLGTLERDHAEPVEISSHFITSGDTFDTYKINTASGFSSSETLDYMDFAVERDSTQIVRSNAKYFLNPYQDIYNIDNGFNTFNSNVFAYAAAYSQKSQNEYSQGLGYLSERAQLGIWGLTGEQTNESINSEIYAAAMALDEYEMLLTRDISGTQLTKHQAAVNGSDSNLRNRPQVSEMAGNFIPVTSGDFVGNNNYEPTGTTIFQRNGVNYYKIGPFQMSDYALAEAKDSVNIQEYSGNGLSYPQLLGGIVKGTVTLKDDSGETTEVQISHATEDANIVYSDVVGNATDPGDNAIYGDYIQTPDNYEYPFANSIFYIEIPVETCGEATILSDISFEYRQTKADGNGWVVESKYIQTEFERVPKNISECRYYCSDCEATSLQITDVGVPHIEMMTCSELNYCVEGGYGKHIHCIETNECGYCPGHEVHASDEEGNSYTIIEYCECSSDFLTYCSHGYYLGNHHNEMQSWGEEILCRGTLLCEEHGHEECYEAVWEISSQSMVTGQPLLLIQDATVTVEKRELTSILDIRLATDVTIDKYIYNIEHIWDENITDTENDILENSKERENFTNSHKNGNPLKIKKGDKVTYKIVLENNSKEDISLQIKDILPSYSILESITESSTGEKIRLYYSNVDYSGEYNNNKFLITEWLNIRKYEKVELDVVLTATANDLLEENVNTASILSSNIGRTVGNDGVTIDDISTNYLRTTDTYGAVVNKAEISGENIFKELTSSDYYIINDSSFENSELQFNYDSTNKVAVIVEADKGISGDYVIPSTVTNEDDGITYDVVGIGAYAFYECYGIRSITIPVSIKNISGNAFRDCANVKEFIVEEGSQYFSVEDGVLFDLNKTELIKYPPRKEKVEQFVIRKTVTEIKSDAFYGCENINELIIQNPVVNIADEALDYVYTDITIFACADTEAERYAIENGIKFEECSKMWEISNENSSSSNVVAYITDDESVLTVSGKGKMANFSPELILFSSNYNDPEDDNDIKWPDTVTKLIINEGITNVGEDSFNGTNIREVVFPSTVTTIGFAAFASCNNIVNFEIPTTIEQIDLNAFSFCENLEKISIPESVKEIDYSAFCDCIKLKEVEILNKDVIIKSVAFDGISEEAIIYGHAGSTAQVYAEENSITFIPFAELEYTYDSNLKSASITGISDGVELVGDYAIPSQVKNPADNVICNVTSIENNVFVSCEDLESIKIPDTVTYIGENNFIDATNLTIYGSAETTAETYANDNNIKFIPFDVDIPVWKIADSIVDCENKKVQVILQGLDEHLDFENFNVNEIGIDIFTVDENDTGTLNTTVKTNLVEIGNVTEIVNGTEKTIGIECLLEISEIGNYSGIVGIDIAAGTLQDMSLNKSEFFSESISVDLKVPEIEISKGKFNEDTQTLEFSIFGKDKFLEDEQSVLDKINIYTKDENGAYVKNNLVHKRLSVPEKVINGEDITEIKYTLYISNFGEYSGTIGLEIEEGAFVDTTGNKSQTVEVTELKAKEDWRIFYNNGENVFLIAEDVLPTSMITSENIGINDSSEVYWTETYTDTVDESDIDFEKFMFSDTFTETNQNYIQISTLLKTENWKNLISEPYAISAIGSPTLEMFLSSWNEKYPNDRIYYHKSNENGYYIGIIEDYEICENTNAMEALSNTAGTNMNFTQFEGVSDELYFGTDTECEGYWIAAPSPWVFDMCIYYSLNTGHWSCSSGSGLEKGIRPVICLWPETVATKEADTWILDYSEGDKLSEVITADNYGDFIDYPISLSDKVLTINALPFAELEYTYDAATQTAEVSGVVSGVTLEGEYTIPRTVVNPDDGLEYIVTSIGNGAFNTCLNLTNIVIPDSIIKISESAFEGCTGLTNIILPENLKEIGAYAFAHCAYLEEITIPESTKTIGNNAFYATNLSEVILNINDANRDESEKLSLGSEAFGSCAEDFTIYVRLNSSAHTYAIENSINYKIMDVASIEIGGATYGYLTFEEAFEASEENGTITLLEDLEITEETVLDLENKTIIGNIKNTSKLTLKNGKVNGTITNDGTLTTENIEIVSDTCALTTSVANTMDAENIVFNINLGTILKGKESAISNNVTLLECTVNLPEGYKLVSAIEGEYEVSNLEKECTEINIFANNTVEEWKKGDINKDGFITGFDAKILAKIVVGWDEIKEEYFDTDEDGIISESEEENYKNICDINSDGEVNPLDRTNLVRKVIYFDNTYEPDYFYKDESITFSAHTEPENQEVTWSVIDIDEEGNSLGTSSRATIDSTTGEFRAIDTGLVKITATSKTNNDVTDVLVLNIVEKCERIKITVNNITNEWKKGDINKDGYITGIDANILSRILAGWENIDIEYFDEDGDGILSETEEANYMYVCDMNSDEKISTSDGTYISQVCAGFESTGMRNIIYKDDRLTFKPYTEPENQEGIWSVTDIELDEENNVIDLGTNNRATIDSETGELTALDTGLVEVTVISKTTPNKLDTLVLEIKEKCTEIYIISNAQVEEQKVGDINKDGLITDFDISILRKIVVTQHGMELKYFDADGDGILSETEEQRLYEICDLEKDGHINASDLIRMGWIVNNNENSTFEINKLLKGDFITLNTVTVPENDEVVWTVVDVDADGNELGTSSRATINSTTGELTTLQAGLIKITATPKTNTELFSVLVIEIEEKCEDIRIYNDGATTETIVGDINRDGLVTGFDAKIFVQILAGSSEIKITYFDLDGDGIISESEEANYMYVCDTNETGNIDINDYAVLHMWPAIWEEGRTQNIIYTDDVISLKSYTEPENQEVIWSVTDIEIMEMDSENIIVDLETNTKATIDSATGELTALDVGLIKVTATSKTTPSKTDTLVLEIKEKTSKIRIYVNRKVDNQKIGDLNKDGYITDLDLEIIYNYLMVESTEGIEEYIDYDGDGSVSEEEVNEFMMLADYNKDNNIDILDCTLIFNIVNSASSQKDINIIYKDDLMTFLAATLPENDVVVWSVEDIDEEGNSLGTSARATINSTTGEFTALETGLVKITAIPETNKELTSTIILNIKERTSEISIYANQKVETPETGDVNRDGYITDFDAKIILKYDVGLLEEIKEYMDIDVDGTISEEEKNEFIKLGDCTEDGKADFSDSIIILNIAEKITKEKNNNVVYKDDVVAFLASTLPENDIVTWSVEDIDEEENSLGTSNRATIDSSTGEFTALNTGLVKITAIPETNKELTSVLILEIKERTSKIDIYVNQKVNNPEVGDLNRDGFFTEVDSLILLKVTDGHDMTEYKDVNGDGTISESEEEEFFRLCDINSDGEIKVFDSVKLMQKIQQVKTTGENAKFYKNESITFSATTTPEGDDVVWSVEDMDEEGNSLGTNARATINSSTGEFTALDTGFVKVTATPKSNSSLSSYFILDISEYTITYDLDGGSLEEGVTNPGTYNVNDSFTLNNPTKVGHTFIGWTTDEITEPVMNLRVEAGTKGNKTYKANYSVNTYELLIQYYEPVPDLGGALLVRSYVEQHKYGEEFKVISPEITGYTPDIPIVEGVMGAEDISFNVIYKANTNTKYTVEHYLQNLENDDYTLYKTYESAGTTNDYTLAVSETIEGFTGLEADQERINADGSTVIKIYYTRNYYTVTVKYLYEDGSEALEPLVEQYKYESYFAVGAQPIAGYTPDEMIYETGIMWDTTFEFVYSPNTDTEYTVQHYKQNLENDDYTLVETESKTGTTDTNTEATSKGYEGFTVQEIIQQNINGNGRSIVEVYYDRNSYQLTYKVDGVQDGEVETYKFEAPITPRENPSKTGYKFSGWNGVPEIMPANNLEITGTFIVDDGQTKELSYTVEYYKNGTKVDADTQIVKQTVQLLEPDILTVDKSKINVTDKYLGYECNTSTTVIPDTIENGGVIKVYYNIVTYKITCTSALGEFPEWFNPPTSYTVEDSVTIENPYVTGYDFIGWSGTNIDTVVHNILIEKGTTGDLDFFANYEIKYYQLSYTLDGYPYGEVKTCAYGERIIPEPDPEVYGYKFSGWNNLPETMPANDVEVLGTLIVDDTQRKDISYKVEYYKDGELADTDTVVENVQVLTNDLTVDNSQINITDKYYGYRYEKTEPVVIPETISDGGVIKVFYVLDDGNTKTLNYKVEYYKDGVLVPEDTQIETKTVQILEDDILSVDKSKINTTKYLGYLCSGTEPSQIPDTISTGSVIKVNYTAIPYEIRYVLDGGNVSGTNPEFYTINDSFTLNNPEKIGHTFIGWTGNGITEPTMNLTVAAGTMGNLVFDAHYSVNQYELQINYVGIPTDKDYGPLIFSEKYNYGETFSITSPEIPGYTPSIRVVEGVMEARTMTYDVTYTPNTDTPYRVEHYIQGVDGSGYFLNEENTSYGTTDTLTEAVAMEYVGFTAKEIEQQNIDGDESTIIKIYYDRNLYTLTYKVDGVQDGEVETYKFEAPITPRENPSKLGYKFSGWNSVPATMPANNVEVSGTFSIDDEQRKDISYKVEYYKDGELTDTDVFTQNVQVLSNTLTVDKSQINVADKYLGYSFEKTEPESIPEIVEDEAVIKVYYKVNNYTISYDLDGGSFGEASLMGVDTYTVNNAFKLEKPSKEGYTFIGWTENEGDVPEIEKEIPKGSTGNKTFKAHYAINNYNLEISYVYEDGREIAPKHTEAIEYNSNYSVNTPVIPGYTADISVVSGKMEAENKSIVVTYRPNADTLYKVEHYKQNVENNEYTLIDTENMSGTTDTDTMAIAKEYEGFTVGEIANVKISGNGDSVAKVYYTRNSYNYQVRYFYDNVENEENRATISALYESIVNTYENKVIPGYGLDKTENLPLTIKIAEEENIINVYYVRQGFDYTVHYFFDGVERVEEKEIGNALFGNIIEEYQDKVEYGYKFEKVENYPLTVTENSENNNINVYYIRKDSNVIVEYRDLVTNEEISEKVIKQAKVFDSFDVSEDVKEIEGYTLIERPEVLTGEYSEEEQIKVYKYAKNSQVKVNYLEKDTNTILAESIVINGYETKEYETEAKQIENYTFVECENPKGKMGREEIVVNYYYAQNTKVTVNYIDMYTNEVLETVVQDGIVGDEYSSKSKEIDNYVLVEKPEQEEVTMQKEEIVLNYYYVMISKGVIEKHIDLVTNEIIHTAVHEGNEKDPYKIEPISQEEYILVEDKLPTNAEGLMEKNAIIVTYFYMKKASVKVIYVDELTQEVLSEEIIEGYESKAYKAQEKAFEGYNLTVRPDKTEGAMKVTKDEEGNVHTETILTYKYRKVSGGVIEKHYDIKTNEVLAEKVYSGLENDSYKIEPKVFEGYDIYEEKIPENAEGLMTQDVIEVNYYYIRKATVKIEYINVNTNEKIVDDIILNRHEGDEYKSERKKFASYIILEERLPEKESGIIEITKDEEGNLITEINIKYYYARKTSIRVEYIDKNSSEKISKDYVLEGYEGQDYKVEAKEIEGYKLLDEQENAEGKMTKDELVVKFYYEKIKVEKPEDNKQEEQPEKDPSEESPVEPPKEETPDEKPGDTEGDKEESQTITSNTYAVKENRISKIISGTSVAELKKNIAVDGKVVILNRDGKEVKDDDLVKTDMKLKLENNEEYNLIVRGDISCDGKISLTDLSKLILHYNEKKGFILSDSPYYAADLNHDDKVSIIDVSQMLILYNSI